MAELDYKTPWSDSTILTLKSLGYPARSEWHFPTVLGHFQVLQETNTSKHNLKIVSSV